ncbi:MAG: bifunctional demethylmenaquinone methyltransferase/2-methoxy-6-polyprenyl-1,4-benzoquinol methylase UbiE [Muribaculaceae bacterium]|nr:bifunctional demethylmenaquinone methyltransferase/2-methoxy-6-polyprenyl-1,4-benzoquinol methylase UbiE [Muribaculaceae bacterium]MDE6610620.1 bifunctional demethylmenaquinone methyltransferase/2-methoxy-6-polyprenyl-1,4-benzoquinol methylase UbiE [Muribaculaceae bacterium]
MFDSIAPAYDFMNRAMTLGVDRTWRRKAVEVAAQDSPANILDLATGTADLAIALAQRIPGATITGADLSERMIEAGRAKVDKAGLGDRVNLQVADGMHLPMPDATFDCITIAYGIRNFASMLDGYREMWRVLRPGGRVVVLELSTPTNPVALGLYHIYTRTLIPAVGRLLSRDRRAYSYLPESVRAVAQGTDMTALMTKAGFTDATFRRLTLGSCTIYTATKPA